MRRRWCLPLAAAATIAFAAPASATRDRRRRRSPTGSTTRATSRSPKDGDVYVAESGRGGDHATAKSCFDSAEGPACTGATGAVTQIGRWGQERCVKGLASFAPAERRQRDRPARRLRRRRRRLLHQRRPDRPDARHPARASCCATRRWSPRTDLGALGTLLQVKRHGAHPAIADVWRVRDDVNPDAQVGNPLVDSNPVDVLVDRGRFVMRRRGRQQRHAHRPRRLRSRRSSVFPNIPTPEPVRRPDSRCRRCRPAWSGARTAATTSASSPASRSRSAGRRLPGRSPDRRVHDYATGFTMRDGPRLRRRRHALRARDRQRRHPRPAAAPTAGSGPCRRRREARQIALPAGTLTEPGGIAVGRHGKLYVSNHSRSADNGEVLRIDLD